MIEGKNILITGGCGFLGSHLVKRLIDNNQITIFDNMRRNALQFFSDIPAENLTIIEADILDKTALAKAVHQKDIILHLAAMAGVSSYYEFPLKTMQVNLLGTSNLLEAIEQENIERFINFSTSEVYGARAVNVSENTSTAQGSVKGARWTYSVSKLAAEHLCFAYHKEKNYPIVSIRPFNIYGPGQIGEGGIQKMVPLALNNDTLMVTGDGKQTRAWCYVDNFIDGVCLALETKNIEGEAFNIGTPHETSILKLAEMIIQLSGSHSTIEFIEHPGEDIHIRFPDISKAEKMLGYRPKMSLEEGLIQTINWYKNNLKAFLKGLA